MALHERRHPEPVAGCFGCKVIGLSYGTVPGAYKDMNSTTMFDGDAVRDQFGDTFSKERIEDKRADMRRHYHEFQEASNA